MHLQMAFRQTCLKLRLEGFCFLLATAVHQSIICIPTPWEIRVCPCHPGIKRIVEKEVGQNRANHAPYTKGNFDRRPTLSLRFGADPKESGCYDEW